MKLTTVCKNITLLDHHETDFALRYGPLPPLPRPSTPLKMATVGIAEDLKTGNGLEALNDLYILKLFVYEPEMGLNVFFF